MRYIDADALRERMYHEVFDTDSDMQKWDSGCWIRYKLFEKVLKETPTVEGKHGHWEIAIGYDPKKSFQCSECRLMAYEPNEYCSHCGAKMDEVTE